LSLLTWTIESKFPLISPILSVNTVLLNAFSQSKSKPHDDATSVLLGQLSSKTPPTANVGEDVGEKEPSYTAGGNASQYNDFGKQYGGFLKKLNRDLPYDPAIPFLGIYPKE
jgi:hypothetical protein